MSDIKTVKAYSQVDELGRECDLWARRFDYVMSLTPRAFAELQGLSLTSGLSVTVLVDAWVQQK